MIFGIPTLRHANRIGIGFSAVLAYCSAAGAAPPTVNALTPAGVTKGQSRLVKADGSFSHWPPQVWVDRDGIRVSPRQEKQQFDVTADQGAGGVFYLRFYDSDGASAIRPFEVDTLASVDEKEPNNSLAESQIVQMPATIDGVLHASGEVDVFAVPLKKGQTLVASLSANWRFGSPMDAVMQIVDGQGFVTQQNDDNVGFDPRIAFLAPADGTYHVRIFAFPATPNSTIAYSGSASYIYRLTMTCDGFIDHCFPLAIGTDSSQTFEAKGWNIPADTPLQMHPDLEGQVQLRHANLASYMTVPRVTYPLSIANPNQTLSVSVPTLISGSIELPDQTDRFVFEAKKGQSIRIQVDSDVLGFLLDPVVRLRNEAGEKIAESDDSDGGRDCEFRQTIPADGAYTVEIGDLYGNAGKRYAYRMAIDSRPPEFALTLANDAFTGKIGSKLSIPVTIVRERGFSDGIELEVKGLPPSCTAVKVTADKNAKTATVVIECGKEPVSAPIEIVGRAVNDPQIQRSAAFTVAQTIHRHHVAWITVTP